MNYDDDSLFSTSLVNGGGWWQRRLIKNVLYG